MINTPRFQQLIAEAEAAAFTGWDFQWLGNRLIQQDPPWDYPALVRAKFSKVTSLLDMGTGGGELLESLVPLPPDSHATEAYFPNQSLAVERLSKLGVKVHPIDEDANLPFAAEQFDLVINRHESYDPHEVWRILKPNGMFITQQVSGLDNLELNQVLEDNPSLPFFNWGLTNAAEKLCQANFIIEQVEQAVLQTIFKDVGAVVYYLKAIPWQVEGFSIETHLDKLAILHNTIERNGYLMTTAHRFLIVARKKEASQ
jgi:SAM-dependent methyltransferase